MTINKFEIVLFTTVPWDRGTKFEVDSHTGGRNDHADHPYEETKTDTSRQEEDGARRGEDTGSNHTVEDQEESGDGADLTFLLGQLMLKRIWRPCQL